MKPSKMELLLGAGGALSAHWLCADIGFLGLRDVTNKLFARAGLVTYRIQFGYLLLNILKGVS